MTKEQAQEFQDRWQAVKAIQIAERRASSIERRWQQLNAIWEMALALGLPPRTRRDVEVVRARWAKLKRQEE